MKLLSQSSSALYFAFFAALIASVSVYAWQNAAEVLPSLAQRTSASLPATATIGAAFGSLALIVLLEALYPLRSLSLGRWVYADRPRGHMRGVDKLSIAQLAGVSLLGLALCTSLHLPLHAAIALPLLRFLIGWRSFNLASLLRAGRTRAVGSSSFGLLDSEVSADATASQCGAPAPALARHGIARSPLFPALVPPLVHPARRGRRHGPNPRSSTTAWQPCPHWIRCRMDHRRRRHRPRRILWPHHRWRLARLGTSPDRDSRCRRSRYRLHRRRVEAADTRTRRVLFRTYPPSSAPAPHA